MSGVLIGEGLGFYYWLILIVIKITVNGVAMHS